MSARPTVMVSSWSGGLTMLRDGEVRREFEGLMTCGLASDGAGGAYAVVDSGELWSYGAAGGWRRLASSELPLRCCVAAAGRLYVGTDDARVLALEGEVLRPLDGLQATAGHETWYAGAALSTAY